MTAFDPGLTLVSSAVSVARRQPDGSWAACLLRGAPGSGKSTMAIHMLGLGAALVSDDVVGLSPSDDGSHVFARGPNPPLAGLLETPDLGFLRVEHVSAAPLKLVADFRVEGAPAPDPRDAALERTTLLNVSLPKVQLRRGPSAAAALFCLLGGAEMIDPPDL